MLAYVDLSVGIIPEKAKIYSGQREICCPDWLFIDLY